MKSLRDVNIKLTKEEFKQLKITRDGFLIASLIWTALVYFIINYTNTCNVKILACYVALIGFWGFTFFLNYLMIKIKRYMKSLFIRPALSEEDNTIHRIK